MRFLVHLAMVGLGCGALAQPGASTGHDGGIQELLSYSVPPEDWQEHLKKRKREGWVPPPMPSIAPSASAEMSELAEYWRTDHAPHHDEPDPKVRDKLLAYCEKNPAVFRNLSAWFLGTQNDTVNRIKELHARLSGSTKEDQEARSKVHHWLMTQAGLFREELRVEAEVYFDSPDDAKRQESFDALEKFEPASAKEALLRHSRDTSPAARCAALLRLHGMKDAQADEWREKLQELITSDAPASIRAQALLALADVDWPGKADWVLGLFKDPDLGEVKMREYHVEQPLASIVRAKPDFWIPQVVSLVGHSNRAVHDNAVRCLAQFHLEAKREDALRPLLPWLSDPKWALDEEHDGRLRLLQTLDSVNLPESVPGLLWALKHDSEYRLTAAASALAHYKAVQAVPMLKKAIQQENDHRYRKSLVEALLKMKGANLAEQAQAVEKYTLQTLTEEGRRALQDEWMLPAPVLGEAKSSIAPEQRLLVTTGMVIEDNESLRTAELAEALAKRVRELRAEKPELAEELEIRISLWETPASVGLVLNRLERGRISAPWVADLLTNNHLQTSGLSNLKAPSGAASAVVALLLKDESRVRLILDGSDPSAQAMLLACARLQRKPLPLDVVARLLNSKHILCARGAELYLQANDSREARAMLLRRFKGEARILGARMSHDPGHFTYGALGEIQELLRQRVLEAKGPLEIHALLSAGYWGNVGQVWVEVEGEKATLTNDQGSGRHRTRPLTAGELANLRSYLSRHRVDDLPPLTLPVDDGIQYEYVHLSAEGGRRVFMNNPGTYSGGLVGHGAMFVPAHSIDKEVNDSVYVGLVRLFQDLMEDESQLQVTYRTQTPIPGLKIVIPQEQKHVGAVMDLNGVLIVNSSRGGAKTSRWTAVSEGDAGKTEKTWDGPALKVPGSDDGLQVREHADDAPWRTSAAGGHVRAASRDKDNVESLWILREKKDPELIVQGTFAGPITSLDGQWVVAARKLGRSWAQPNDVVRINMTTHEIIPLRLAPADNFDAITRLPDSGKILIRRRRDPADASGTDSGTGPAEAEYHLLDPPTGVLERARGEFGPLHHETWRPLQPTGEPGIVWASMSKYEKGRIEHVALGRYDLRTFSFMEVMKIPRWQVSSMDFWVDEKTRTVFLAMGDLLSFPLPEEVKQ